MTCRIWGNGTSHGRLAVITSYMYLVEDVNTDPNGADFALP